MVLGFRRTTKNHIYMPETTIIHGHHTAYEKDAYEGVRYLKVDLDFKEAEVFFREARTRGSADFEDDKDRQFTLIYRDGVYTLTRR